MIAWLRALLWPPAPKPPRDEDEEPLTLRPAALTAMGIGSGHGPRGAEMETVKLVGHLYANRGIEVAPKEVPTLLAVMSFFRMLRRLSRAAS